MLKLFFKNNFYFLQLFSSLFRYIDKETNTQSIWGRKVVREWIEILYAENLLKKAFFSCDMG